mmetsp:Transcript_1128/g.2266  ORF Transcript_1128/g.2266 Transcript_1128/m.2266 type:complete len:99 (+) Transcript_1128:575-871(+)
MRSCYNLWRNKSIQYLSNHLPEGATEEETVRTRQDSKRKASADNEQLMSSINGTRHTGGACSIEEATALVALFFTIFHNKLSFFLERALSVQLSNKYL